MTRDSGSAAFQEERFTQIQEAEEIQKKIERDGQILRPKIQRVAHYLRGREKFAKYYSPKLVSFGPIHRGGKNLKLGEQYKLIWTGMYVEGSIPRAIYLHQQIATNIEGLRKLYTEDIVENYTDKDLAWMLFVDGCSLLQIMDKNDLMHPELLKVKVDQLVLVMMDVLLLENQLPFQVFKLRESRIQVDQQIDQRLDRLDPNSPTHLLDCLRTIVFGDCHLKKEELKKAGIRVKRDEKASQTDITFRSFGFAGTIYLSKLIVDETIAPGFLNLIAYEMCADYENNFAVSSYVAFLDSLIDNPDDVKELRSVGVLHNALGSDEEVAELFNTIATDVVPILH